MTNRAFTLSLLVSIGIAFALAACADDGSNDNGTDGVGGSIGSGSSRGGSNSGGDSPGARTCDLAGTIWAAFISYDEESDYNECVPGLECALETWAFGDDGQLFYTEFYDDSFDGVFSVDSSYCDDSGYANSCSSLTEFWCGNDLHYEISIDGDIMYIDGDMYFRVPDISFDDVAGIACDEYGCE